MRVPSLLQRAASLLLGCWLAIFVLEPAALHTCPIHDVAAPMAHASHHDTQDTSSPHRHGCCTCPGACCPSVLAPIAVPPLLTAARIVATDVSLPDVTPLVRHGDVQFALPPSIGPPRISG